MQRNALPSLMRSFQSCNHRRLTWAIRPFCCALDGQPSRQTHLQGIFVARDDLELSRARLGVKLLHLQTPNRSHHVIQHCST